MTIRGDLSRKGPEFALWKRFAPQIKVLFMSGYTDDALANHGMLEPDLWFLEKPFSPSRLARKVREIIDQPKETKSSSTAKENGRADAEPLAKTVSQ